MTGLADKVVIIAKNLAPCLPTKDANLTIMVVIAYLTSVRMDRITPASHGRVHTRIRHWGQAKQGLDSSAMQILLGLAVL